MLVFVILSYYSGTVPKNAKIAVLFFNDDRPSDPFMNNELNFLGLGRS